MAKDKSEPRQERYRKKLEGEGGKRVSMLLKPEAAALLDKMAARYGSQTAAVVAGLEALNGRNDLTPEQVAEWVLRQGRRNAP